MNFNCTSILTDQVIDDILYRHIAIAHLHLSNKDKYLYFPAVITGCEIPHLSTMSINKNGSTCCYPSFLRKIFKQKLGCIGSTKNNIAMKKNGQPYMIGRCAEQRACRDVFNKIQPINRNELNFNCLQFSQAYIPRTFQPIEPCCNCKAIFR